MKDTDVGSALVLFFSLCSSRIYQSLYLLKLRPDERLSTGKLRHIQEHAPSSRRLPRGSCLAFLR